MAEQQQERRIISLREELRQARDKIAKHKEFKTAVREALDDAGNPLTVSAEDSVGMALAGVLVAGTAYVMDAATVPKGQERQKGQPRTPSLWSGVVKTAIGGLGWGANLAIPYRFPMGPVRSTARTATTLTAFAGLSELAQTAQLYWERRSLAQAAAQKLALDEAVQQRAAALATSQGTPSAPAKR